MKLQTFEGGESSLLLPQYIAINQGAFYENIDSDKGALVPINTPLAANIAVLPYHRYFNAGKKWVDSASVRDYVEYEQVLYWTDRVSRPQKMTKAGAVSNLGITAPNKVTGVVTEGVLPITEAKITAAAAGAGLPTKDYYYLLINEGSTSISSALQFLVDSRRKVTTIVQATSNPVVKPVLDTTSNTTTFTTVTVSDITGVTAGANGFKLYRQYNGVYRLVGTVSGTLTDSVENISANPALNYNLFSPLDGVYQYVMTYYSLATGSESAPSPVSDELDVDDGGFITLTNLSISNDPQVDKKRLYRVGGNLGEFTLIDTIDNALVTYVDNVRDVNAAGTLLSTSIAAPAPIGLKYLQEAYAMLFGALKNTVRFTPIGKPEEWPEVYFLQFDDEITGLAPVANGLLAFTKFRTYIITGNGPTSLSQYLLSSDQGCIAFESVQLIATEAVWASLDGICSSSGNRPTVITKDKLGKLKLNPIDSAIYDEAYYLMEANGKVLCYQKGIIKRFDFGTRSLEVANDILYGYRDGYLYEIFNSDEPAYWNFTSARFTEGAFTTNKTYKKILLYSRGRVIINILINDVIVQTKELTSEDSHTIQVPQLLQRGFYIQFKLEGTGSVFELEYDIGTQG